MTLPGNATTINSLSLFGRVVPTILVGLFLAELSVMLLLDYLQLQGGLFTALVDALLLTVFVLPGLYIVVLLPLAKLASRLATATADARFRAVVEAAGDAIIICDLGGRIVFANRAASEVFDYGWEELVGAEVTKLIPEDRWEKHVEGFHSYLAGGRSRENDASPRQIVGRRRNGSLVPLEMTLSASSVARDNLILGVLRDLRPRR
jgi:PAS domain S-box-containing protein